MARTSRPDVLEARTRAQQALRLRMSGATLQQVADQLGYHSRQAVFKATTSLLDRQESDLAAEWRVLQLARLERMLVAVWQDAIAGDDRASRQALRIVHEIGRTTGVSRPMRAETSSSGPATDPHPTIVFMSEDEWKRRFDLAREQAGRP